MVKASLIAAGLLSVMFIGLTYISSFYTPVVGSSLPPEQRLSAISIYLLGPYGGFISCIAVSMACMTTAIPLVSIAAEYIRETMMDGRGGNIVPEIATLTISGILANLGFVGIASMLSPVLQILCPALIVLSVMNIFHKLYSVNLVKAPVVSAFGITLVSHYFL